VLGRLGTEKAWVVHGSDGTDELTTTGLSYVAKLENGTVSAAELSPKDAGIPLAKPEELKGGDAAFNAAAMERMLAGEPSAFRDVVVYTAAAALVVADRAASLKEGAALAADAIDSGRARGALDAMVRITNENGKSAA
jgi:anthranilate phosphoribosyltransferase